MMVMLLMINLPPTPPLVSFSSSNDTSNIYSNTSNGDAVDSTGNNNINNSTSDDVEINSIDMAPTVSSICTVTSRGAHDGALLGITNAKR